MTRDQDPLRQAPSFLYEEFIRLYMQDDVLDSVVSLAFAAVEKGENEKGVRLTMPFETDEHDEYLAEATIDIDATVSPPEAVIRFAGFTFTTNTDQLHTDIQAVAQQHLNHPTLP